MIGLVGHCAALPFVVKLELSLLKIMSISPLVVEGGFMKSKLIAYLKDEKGQTSTEYILLVAVVATIVIKFKGAITEKLFGDSGVLNTVLDTSKFSEINE